VKGKGNSAFVGLIVHAAVDGVALGAAVAEGDASLGLIVFLAIMLHKAPSSFGLGSYLLLQGYSATQVQARLAVFSSSAPLAALATYALLSANLFAYTRYSLALCLLFSGGTFLYVATAHILPEIQMQRQPSGDASTPGEGGEGEGGPNLTWGEVGVLVGGLLLPLLLNVQHGH
jgi:zinc transporter 9